MSLLLYVSHTNSHFIALSFANYSDNLLSGC
jgi:hypothetical protein